MNFRFLNYSLDDLAKNQEIRKSAFGMAASAKATQYPIRALRYWWVAHVLTELAGTNRTARIVDMGAGEGQTLQYCNGSMPLLDSTYPLTSQRWIALDKCRHEPGDAGYTEWIVCDFDKPLPLQSGSVDVLICIHVMEHLPRPELSISEIARVLTPGGFFLGGSPVTPTPISFFLHRRLRAKMKNGTVGPNGHINSFNPGDWKKLVSNAGLNMKFMTATHFMRHSGASIENSKIWVKANLLWGSLFPSLGSEVYLLAQKRQN